MECNWNSSHPWLPGDKQDFPLGARATSYLPSATASELNYDSNDLPEWMESRDNCGLSPNGLFNDINFPGHKIFNGCFDEDEDYTNAIKPDDMVVPKSELQQEYTPQGLGACTIPEISSSPRVTVRVNKIKVSNQGQSLNSLTPGFQNSLTFNGMQPQYLSYQNAELGQPMEDTENFDAFELMNELANLPEKPESTLTQMFDQLDSSVVQGALNDLLSQLESDDANQEMIEIPQQNPEPLSPAYIVPSPVPSIGYQSPQSAGENSFYQSPNRYVVNEVSHPPKEDKISYASLLSPSEYSSVSSPVVEENKSSVLGEDNLSVLSPLDNDSLSVSSPAALESDDSLDTNEVHSYSRSPQKKKSSRKCSPSSYPEGRKERKKEQNKQAAIRYRQKKKQEDDKLMTQVRAEEERQKKLKAKCSDLKQELNYLKKLMRDVLIAKGTVSPDAFKKK